MQINVIFVCQRRHSLL